MKPAARSSQMTYRSKSYTSALRKLWPLARRRRGTQHRREEIAEAVICACALVATADGHPRLCARVRFDEIIDRFSCVLPLSPAPAVRRFEMLVAGIEKDPLYRVPQLVESLADMELNGAASRLVRQTAISMARAGGHNSAAVAGTVEAISRAVGIPEAGLARVGATRAAPGSPLRPIDGSSGGSGESAGPARG